MNNNNEMMKMDNFQHAEKLGFSCILRKICHIFFGILIILGILFLERGIFLRILFILFLIIIFFTLVHIKYKLKIIEAVSKEEEKTFPLKGLLFFIIGSSLVFLIFQKNIALVSIIILTFGDSASSLASYLGMKYKISPFRKFKSIFGTICGIIVAFLFSLLFIDPLSAIVGSFFGMLSEAVAIKLGESNADDNLIVPLAAGTAIYILTKINVLGVILSNV
jgi:dolichol kinase